LIINVFTSLINGSNDQGIRPKLKLNLHRAQTSNPIMSRVDGKKVVTVAFLGMTAVVGVAQVYAPFMMDKDQLTGWMGHTKEEEEAERFAMERAKKLAQKKDVTEEENATPRGGGSMWQNMGKKK